MNQEENYPFIQERLDGLREEIGRRLSEFRFAHTLGVERMVIRLGELYCPEKIPMLRAAALLHDVTKEYSREEQTAVLKRYGITLAPEEEEGPAAWHAITAAAILPDAFPDLATPEVVSAVRWHTTGHAGMTLTEGLVYLADYIDDTRKFEDCVLLRDRFFGPNPEKMNEEERLSHLWQVIMFSLDLTIEPRLAEGQPVFHDAIEARQEIAARLQKTEKHREGT